MYGGPAMTGASRLQQLGASLRLLHGKRCMKMDTCILFSHCLDGEPWTEIPHFRKAANVAGLF